MEKGQEIAINFDEKEVRTKDLNPEAVVTQSNYLVNGRWRMNLNQSRIFLTAVSMIEMGDDNFERYKINGRQLKDMLDLKGGSFYNQLKKDVGKLMQTYIHVKDKNEKGKEVDNFISLVSSAKYIEGDGDLLIRFDPDLKPYLLNLKDKFTQFKLMEALKLKSMYSIRFYLLLKQFDATGWRYMSVDEIRDKLGLNKGPGNDLKKDLYPLVGDLKRRVLEPAVNELSQNGFVIKVEERKEGRKIVGFEFRWKLELERSTEQARELNAPVRAVSDKQARMIERLRAYKLADRQIKNLMSILTPDEVNKTLWILDQSRSEGKIQPGKEGGFAYSVFKKRFGLNVI